MSHYTVAVFHREDQDIDDLLAPYDESLTVAPYIRFTREEAIEYAKEWWNKEFLDGKTDEEIWQTMASEYDNRTDYNGNIYTTYNPNAKWDWYQVGGRWGGSLKLKKSARKNYCNMQFVDEARIGDVDFSNDSDSYREALRFWEIVVDGAKPDDGEDFFTIYNKEFFLSYYGDKETYARSQSQWSTFAVITPDGIWHEKGEMGWFGASSETPDEAKDWDEGYRERFLEHADPDWILTIVDCHI